MIAINLTAAFELSRAVAKYMIPQRSGRIINICSLFSFLGGLGSPAYAAMKAGLMGLTKAYADELGKYGITVNGIAPGYFQTSMTTGTGSANDEKYIKIKETRSCRPLGRKTGFNGSNGISCKPCSRLCKWYIISSRRRLSCKIIRKRTLEYE